MSFKKEYTLIWFIENYSWHNNGEVLFSPVFTTDDLERVTWCICLYPRGDDEEDKGQLYISLGRREWGGPDSLTVNCSLSVIADDGSILCTNEFTSDFSKNTKWGWSIVEIDEILIRRKADYLPKDTLTVRCKLWTGEGDTHKVAPICARTRIGIEHISFLHVVEGFSALEPNENKTLQVRSSSKKERVLSCDVYISDGSCCDEKVMLEITPSGRGRILARSEISLLEVSGKKIKCAAADNRSSATRKEVGKLSLSLTKKAIVNKKNEWLPDDKLSLLCECTLSTGIEFQKIEGSQNEMLTTATNLAGYNPNIDDTNSSVEKQEACPSVVDDLQDIYTSKFLTDVQMKTKENSYPAHKIVLCARSPVFKVMMSSDMKEKTSDSVQVDDLEDDTVQQLLLFLYSDRLEDLRWETAVKLYYAADKYEIRKLRRKCSSFLVANLTTFTASELLLLADTHSDSYLTRVAKDFILEHEDQVFRSEKWKELMVTNPLLALKTMHLKYNT